MKAILAALAVALAATTAANEVRDTKGIAITEAVSVQRAYTHSGSPRHWAGPFVAEVHANVRAVAAWYGATGGTWNIRLDCPAPVAAASSETLQRTGTALSAGVVLKLSVASDYRDARESETHLCWATVTVRKTGEDEPLRHAMVPVRITHGMKHGRT